jgi:predicted esterase
MKSLRMLLLISTMFLSGSLLALAQEINLLPNGSFEGRLISNWTAVDSCQLELDTRAGHSGKHALAFHPLRDGAGIACDVATILQPGYRYAFSAWFRNAEAGWGQVDVFLAYRETGQDKQLVIGRADCDKQSWANLANEFAIPAGADKSTLRLIIRTAWGRIAFLVDDLNLRPALQVALHRPSTDAAPALIVQIGPHLEKRSKIISPLQIFDNLGTVVARFNQSLDVPCTPALPEGFYRITAVASDLDGRSFTTEKILFIGERDALIRTLENKVDALLSTAALGRYQGWIRYLHFLIGYGEQREGTEGERTLQAAYRLSRWLGKIQADPALLDTLRGVQEWAYLSRVDDSGQPFKLAIPAGYDPRRTWPLVVVMHGYGGNHLEYSGGVQSNPDYFELHVLGRARGGGYTDLSEADVLDAVDYVRMNWRIDERRIHLNGTSMGGGGTFKMTSRYPDRWASGRPICGYGADQPIVNSLQVPLYSTHSQDDPTVPVLLSRAPLQKLIGAGGQVVIDETIGLQHAAWNYHEGNNRALKWMYDQLRPDFREIRRIDFTATDRYSCGAYWLKIAEWGRMPGPARIQATAGCGNQLYLTMDNIRALLIRTADAPLDPQQPLKISLNGKVPLSLAAPLPDSIYISESAAGWTAGPALADLPPNTLHTPGGVHTLYNREPLLIVYGTGGDAAAQKAMANAALAASKSVHPTWVGDQGDIKDGVPSHHILYGRLKVKPDTAVTAADLEKCNLLLIGRAEENRLVERMQKKLPIEFGREIACSDGLRLPGAGTLLGLYYFNPLSPSRLLYWVAAADPAAYQPYNLLLRLQEENGAGNDLLVVQNNPPGLVKARHFDSRWNWMTDLDNSALIAAEENTYGRIFARLAGSLRDATGSDYALQLLQAPPEAALGTTGITRWADVAALFTTTPVAIMDLTGGEITQLQQAFAKAGLPFHFYPAVDDRIDPGKIYQVAMAASFDQVQQLVNHLNHPPLSFRLSDITVFSALKQKLF